MTRMSSPVRSHHSHSHSHSMSQSSNPPRSPSPPSQTFHPGSILLPTPALVESVAGGAHYSGAKMDSDVAVTHRRPSGGDKRDSDSHTDLLPAHQIIRDDLNEMFGARTTIEILRRSWSKDAIFEDPLSHCHGYAEYSAQWFGLNKMFSKSVTLSSRIMSSTHTPNRLVYAQKQEYTLKLIGQKKIIDSVVVVDLDDEDKIIRLVDQWNGKPPSAGFPIYWLRRANAKIVPWLVRVPK